MAKKEETKKTTSPISQFAIGRRKRAVARVRMYEGKGEIIINDKKLSELPISESQLREFMKPLVQVGITEDHYFSAKVVGGGIAGQVDAVKHGIARCISKINEDMKSAMRKGGFLTRDPREKERKKVYHVRARKSPQFSKR
jgi:small subunit ribosomal protein S9